MRKNRMPFCGFNQEMLEGIDNFHNGLVELIICKLSKYKKDKVLSGEEE